MTAFDLIDDIFSRAQSNVAPDIRVITAPQLELLEKLIQENGQAAALRAGANGGFVWRPKGAWDYVVSQNADGTHRRLTRLKARQEGTGQLFA